MDTPAVYMWPITDPPLGRSWKASRRKWGGSCGKGHVLGRGNRVYKGSEIKYLLFFQGTESRLIWVEVREKVEVVREEQWAGEQGPDHSLSRGGWTVP